MNAALVAATLVGVVAAGAQAHVDEALVLDVRWSGPGWALLRVHAHGDDVMVTSEYLEVDAPSYAGLRLYGVEGRFQGLIETDAVEDGVRVHAKQGLVGDRMDYDVSTGDSDPDGGVGASLWLAADNVGVFLCIAAGSTGFPGSAGCVVHSDGAPTVEVLSQGSGVLLATVADFESDAGLGSRYQVGAHATLRASQAFSFQNVPVVDFYAGDVPPGYSSVMKTMENGESSWDCPCYASDLAGSRALPSGSYWFNVTGAAVDRYPTTLVVADVHWPGP